MMISELKDVDIIILNSGIGTRSTNLIGNIKNRSLMLMGGLVLMSTVAMDYFIRERGQMEISSIAAHISSGLALTYCASKALSPAI